MRLTVLLIVAAIPYPALALERTADLAQCRLDTWGVRDGLPPQRITSIAQTPDGFLWLATGAGLMRFDGETFRKFDSKNTPGLDSDNVSELSVDHNGTLWIGGAWNGFGTFSGGQFTRLKPKDDGWSTVTAIHQTPDGAMWFAGFGTDSIFKLEQGRIRSFGGFQDSIPRLLDAGEGSLIAIEYNRGPVLVTSDGARRRFALTHPIPIDAYTCACRTGDGDLWIGTERSGIIRISRGHVTVYSKDSLPFREGPGVGDSLPFREGPGVGLDSGLPSNQVRCTYVDRENRLWVGTSSGLCRWDGQRFKHFGTIDGFNNPDIGSVFEDREGNLWVGAGTVLCRFAATKLAPYSLYIGQQCIGIQSYSSLAEDPGPSPGNRSSVWCVSPHGLAHIDENGVSWVGGPFHRTFDGMAMGPDGNVWLWSHPQNGEYVYTVPLADIRKWLLPAGQVPPDSPAGANLGAYPRAYEKLQFTTAVPSDGTLVAYGVGGETTIKPGVVVGHRPFDAGWVFSVATDASGSTWLGTTTGLWRITNTSVQLIKSEKNTHFLGVDATDVGGPWFATDHGLQRWVDGKLRAYAAKDGLPSTEIFQVVTARDGKLWLGYHSGICSISKDDIDAYDRHQIKSIPFTEFDPADGIRDYPTQFTSLKTSDGRLWFVAPKSITQVSPDDMERNSLAPPVHVIDAVVDGHAISGDDNRLPPGIGNLRVHFAALTFAAPERVRYAYRLVGLDNEWTRTRERLAAYGNLPPGKYQFQVIACNNDGVWNYTGASVDFVIAPHFYQTWWFRVLVTVFAVAMMMGILWLRTATLRRKNLELENKVADRTTALEEALHELTSSNEQLQDIQMELEAQNAELLDTRETLATANERLESLATTDGLTGLKNHRAFQEQLTIEWTQLQRNPRPLSIVLMDVDKFKQYNDAYGHPGGDDVLRRIGQILSECVREADFTARYGGEEFVVVAPDTGVDGATQLAERIRAAIEEAEWPLRGVTASLGVATSTATTDSAAALVALADTALYRSKEAGRNRVTHADSTRPTVSP